MQGTGLPACIMPAGPDSASVDVQRALVVLDALEQLGEVALAKPPAPARLLQQLHLRRERHVIVALASPCRRSTGACIAAGRRPVHAADALNDLQENRGPVRQRRREDLQQDPLRSTELLFSEPGLRTSTSMVAHVHATAIPGHPADATGHHGFTACDGRPCLTDLTYLTAQIQQ